MAGHASKGSSSNGSSSKGASSMMTIGERWINSSCQRGNPVVLIDTLGAQLKSHSALTGSIVIARKMAQLSPEQTVGILLPTSAGGMLANMAGMLLGKTIVNLNFTTSAAALASAIEQAEIKTIYTSSTFLEKLEARGMDTSLLKTSCKLIILEELSASISPLEKFLVLLTCKLAPRKLLKKLFHNEHDANSAAVILFSSGSEGSPKGVILSHHNILTNVRQIAEVLKFNKHDVILANLPLFHAFGLTVTQFMPLLERVKVICHPDPTDVYGSAKAIDKHNITIMFGTSSFYRLYIRNSKVEASMLNSLRLLVAGAEKLQKEVRSEFKNKFDKTIYEGYGATETAPVASVNIPQELYQMTPEKLIGQKPGSVGLPLPDTYIKVVDPDSFQELPAGTAGMILISGDQIMQGYLNNENQSSVALRKYENKIWYVSGDKGYLDEDGFLFILDRYSRFAKVGGEMIGLSSIERAIKEVVNDDELELVAVTTPDTKKGEAITVLSNKELDSNLLRNRLSLSGLSTLALPSKYITVDEIPCLGTGKTDFPEAKRIALEE